MMRAQAAIYMIIILLLVGYHRLNQAGAEEASAEARSQEELAVYSFLLNKNPSRYVSGNPALIYHETVTFRLTDDDAASYANLLPSLDPETLKDFREVNQHPQLIPPHLELNISYQLVTQTEIVKIARSTEGGFHYTKLSRIGFNPSLRQALVRMDHPCTALCGSGNLYFLVKEDGAWRIDQIIGMWVS